MRWRPWSESVPRPWQAPPTRRSCCPASLASLCPRRHPAWICRTFTMFIQINQIIFETLSGSTLIFLFRFEMLWLIWWLLLFPKSSSNIRDIHPFTDTCDVPVLWFSLNLLCSTTFYNELGKANFAALYRQNYVQQVWTTLTTLEVDALISITTLPLFD